MSKETYCLQICSQLGFSCFHIVVQQAEVVKPWGETLGAEDPRAKQCAW